MLSSNRITLDESDSERRNRHLANSQTEPVGLLWPANQPADFGQWNFSAEPASLVCLPGCALPRRRFTRNRLA